MRITVQILQINARFRHFRCVHVHMYPDNFWAQLPAAVSGNEPALISPPLGEARGPERAAEIEPTLTLG